MSEKSKSGEYNKTKQMEITPMSALNQAAQNIDIFGTPDVVSSSNIQNETNTIDTNFEISDTDYTFSSFDNNFNNDNNLINQVKDDLNESLQWYVGVVDNIGSSPRANIGGNPRPVAG